MDNKNFEISMEELEKIAGGRSVYQEECFSIRDFCSKTNFMLDEPEKLHDIIDEYFKTIGKIPADPTNEDPYRFETFLKENGYI